MYASHQLLQHVGLGVTGRLHCLQHHMLTLQRTGSTAAAYSPCSLFLPATGSCPPCVGAFSRVLTWQHPHVCSKHKSRELISNPCAVPAAIRASLQVLLQLQAPSNTAHDNSPACPGLQQLFDQTMLQLELWLMQQLVQQLTPGTAVPTAVTACMTMLQSVAGKAAELAVAGVDVAAVEAACTTARQQVDTAVDQRQLQAVAEFALPHGSIAAAGSWRLPSGILPAGQPAMQQQQGLAAAQARAEANLRSLEFVETSPSSSSSILQQLERLKGLLSKASTAGSAAGSLQGGNVEAQHSLRSFERLLFSRAAAVFDQPVLTAKEVAALASTVDTYRVALAAFRRTLAAFHGVDSSHDPDEGGAASMRTSSTAAPAAVASLVAELRSREVLVGWAAFCLTHQAAAAAHPMVLDFGVAVDWRDLRHLSLTDKAATDAVQGVCSYLKQRSKSRTELFHLSKQIPSIVFAQIFAEDDATMQAMLQVHEAAAAKRMEKHWEEVQEQQELAASLRGQIRKLKSDLQWNEMEQKRHKGQSRHTQAYYDTANEISILTSKIYSRESELGAAEKPPPPVIQPLPREQHLARQWLFFLHMPDLLRHLARSSCLAQQLLLPQPLPSSSAWPGRVTGLATSLPAFYNSKQADHRYHTPAHSTAAPTEWQAMCSACQTAHHPPSAAPLTSTASPVVRMVCGSQTACASPWHGQAAPAQLTCSLAASSTPSSLSATPSLFRALQPSCQTVTAACSGPCTSTAPWVTQHQTGATRGLLLKTRSHQTSASQPILLPLRCAPSRRGSCTGCVTA